MIIDISTINFNGGGGGGAPAKLQTKTVDTTINGRQMVYPDKGYNGMSEVTVITDITGRTSALNFTSLGYDADLCAELNVNINESVTYSKTLYDAWNPSNTSAYNLYKNDTNLIYAPNINTCNVTNMKGLFSGCENLTTVPLLDTSKVTNMNVLFENCSSLTSVPLFDTSKVTDMGNMFITCPNLITIPALDTSKVTNIGGMFAHCSRLESLPLLDFGSVTSKSYVFGFSNITTLTTLGGFKNLKINWNDTGGLYRLPNLTYQSVMNVINNLYDFRGNGDTTTTRTIRFNSDSLALLSDDDKAIATAKGWILS